MHNMPYHSQALIESLVHGENMSMGSWKDVLLQLELLIGVPTNLSSVHLGLRRAGYLDKFPSTFNQHSNGLDELVEETGGLLGQCHAATERSSAER